MSWCDNGVSLLRDERIAPLAVSALPAWLWSLDASRILWANPTGAAIFGAATSSSVATRKFDPGQPASAQIADLAARLPANGSPITVSLRGFGAGVGRALTCRCSRIALPNRNPAILVVASERAGPDLPLDERVSRLLAGCDQPVAAFSVDGRLIYARPIAAPFLGHGASLAALGIDALAEQALRTGHATAHAAHSLVRLDRLGDGKATVLLAAFADLDETDIDVTGIIPKESHAATVLATPIEPATTGAAETAVAEHDVSPQALVAEPTEQVASATNVASAAPAVAAVSVPADEVTVVPASPAPSYVATEEIVLVEAVVPTAPGPAVAARSVEPVAAMRVEVQDLGVQTPLPDHVSEPARVEAHIPITERRHPLRFVWQIDADGRFALGSEEFVALAGPTTAALLGRPWSDIASELNLDPEHRVADALATRDTWSGLTVGWPIDGSPDRLTVELSGLPSFDRDRQFRGYRGFGVCRDIDRLNALVRMRNAGPARAAPSVAPLPENVAPASTTEDASGDTEPPTLSNVEHHAFYELSRRLTHHLNHDDEALELTIAPSDSLLSPAGDMRQLFDRLPIGILIYRLEHLIYANRAFLQATGHGSLDDLIEAGGLESLLLAPDRAPVEAAPGKPFLLSIVHRDDEGHVDVELIPVLWESEAAHALLVVTRSGTAEIAAAPLPPAQDERVSDQEAIAAAREEVAQAQRLVTHAQDAAAQAQAEASRANTEIVELRAILDTATDGVVVLDCAGAILSANRSAEALFGYDARELVGRPFFELFAPDSVDVAATYLDGVCADGVVSMVNSGRNVTGRVRQGGYVPLFMSMGRIGEDAGKLCAVFRDVTPWKKVENELLSAKRRAENASAAKSDLLAKISHEIRTPLNAIIGFSEVMMQERFGPMVNDRYRDYAKDIHASGGHLMSLINDLLDLSKIEAGKLELSLDKVSLNDLAQQCVALMQPQANRERIVIRSSLPPGLPQVTADARSVRQIALNLLSNSIKFTEAGGQVIVSTALSDSGHVALRVRDNGIGMSEKDIATALEPFRQLETTIPGRAGGTGLGLPLTKALAEANRARFQIKSSPGEGTLVEVTFPVAQSL